MGLIDILVVSRTPLVALRSRYSPDPFRNQLACYVKKVRSYAFSEEFDAVDIFVDFTYNKLDFNHSIAVRQRPPFDLNKVEIGN